MLSRKQDHIYAVILLLLTCSFLVAAATNDAFFEWAFDRHHSQWSWYIRPLFIIPFCYFAYKRTWSGISATIFALFTSMFWFNRPEEVSDSVIQFLQFEKDWLQSEWSAQKLLLMATVPISLIALGAAFWKRNLLFGLAVVIMMATGKVIWSITSSGAPGKSIVVPAAVGLGLCTVILAFGFKFLNRKKEAN